MLLPRVTARVSDDALRLHSGCTVNVLRRRRVKHFIRRIKAAKGDTAVSIFLFFFFCIIVDKVKRPISVRGANTHPTSQGGAVGGALGLEGGQRSETGWHFTRGDSRLCQKPASVQRPLTASDQRSRRAGFWLTQCTGIAAHPAMWTGQVLFSLPHSTNTMDVITFVAFRVRQPACFCLVQFPPSLVATSCFNPLCLIQTLVFVFFVFPCQVSPPPWLPACALICSTCIPLTSLPSVWSCGVSHNPWWWIYRIKKNCDLKLRGFMTLLNSTFCLWFSTVKKHFWSDSPWLDVIKLI